MYLLRTCERSNVSVEKKKEKKKQNWKVNIEGEFLFSVRERGEKKKRKEKKGKVCTQVRAACTYGPPARGSPTPVTHTNHGQWFTATR